MIRRNTLFKRIKDVAHSFDPQSKVILFGSRARGDNRKDSDWDFMVLTNKEFDWKQENEFRNKVYYDIELKTDAVLYTTIENYKNWELYKNADPFFINIANEGVEI
jgi:uncharacterized protein